MIFLQLFLLGVGFIMLMKGADWFVDGSAGLACKLGIPQLVIGLTIVAMGTSAPETAVSLTAALEKNAGIAIGNVLGSNVLNILVILGITACITSVAIQNTTVWIEIPFMLVVTVVLIGIGYFDGTISFIEGILLWILFLAYLGYLFYMAKKNKGGEEVVETVPNMKLIGMLIFGIGIIVLGGTITVNSAKELARAVGMSERVIGLTIVALGTSLPELVTSVTAAKKGNADIAIGNIVGSNIFNILFILGTTALITPIAFEPVFLVDGIMAIVAGVLLWIAVVRTRLLKRFWGIVMLIVYAGYFIYLF